MVTLIQGQIIETFTKIGGGSKDVEKLIKTQLGGMMYNQVTRGNTWTPGHLDTWTPGHLDTLTPGPLDPCTHGHLNSWTPGHLDTCTPEHQETASPGHQDTWTL